MRNKMRWKWEIRWDENEKVDEMKMRNKMRWKWEIRWNENEK